MAASLKKRKRSVRASSNEEDHTDHDLGTQSSLRNREEILLTDIPATKHLDSFFVGDPIPKEEAVKLWPDRYRKKNSTSSRGKKTDPDEMGARYNYQQAMVDKILYNLHDYVSFKTKAGEENYICQIIEFFEGTDLKFYFTAKWFHHITDTIIQNTSHSHDPQRIFMSDDKEVNALCCILLKINIVKLEPNMDSDAKKMALLQCDFYYDIFYSFSYSSFTNLPPGNKISLGKSLIMKFLNEDINFHSKSPISSNVLKPEISILDLFSGCGAMSAGLCFGAKISKLNLVTKWAVDKNKFACKSFKNNHPEIEVRQERAQDFLTLLQEWEKLCRKYKLFGTEWSARQNGGTSNHIERDHVVDCTENFYEFKIECIVGICFGDPHNTKTIGLKFKVRWKGGVQKKDTWEPVENLSQCTQKIESFVRSGFQKRIIPLPGMVDIICGGPPCRGVSGLNHHRKEDAHLDDLNNRQIQIFMDIVEFLKPKYVLMENVVDLLKFSGGYLGRYAIGRLVEMNYQARLGLMAAGCYGHPQFRLRCFIWGAQRTEKLPQFPLPSHDVIVRGGIPKKFQRNLVAYFENKKPALQRALVLEDAISDLPRVHNDEIRDETFYRRSAVTDLQRFVRLNKNELLGTISTGEKLISGGKLYDHIPRKLNADDFQRVRMIPKRKGSNFRDLPGVFVGPDNVVEWDPTVEREYLPSGKPLVPKGLMTYRMGKSSRPFGRLWRDETVSTVLTKAEPHTQRILHPVQDRVLTIREIARLQGFPDFYRFYGPVRQRYMQVGNAVAFPVSGALGYCLGLAYLRQDSDGPECRLPPSFPGPFVQQSLAPLAVESSGR